MKYIGVLGRGFLIWIIPLMLSFFFYSPERELTTSYALFKSVMVVTLTFVTLAVNMIRPVTDISPVLVAVVYTVVSIMLDLVVVIPMTGLNMSEYVEQIALIYTVIPALSWGILSQHSLASRLSHQRN